MWQSVFFCCEGSNNWEWDNVWNWSEMEKKLTRLVEWGLFCQSDNIKMYSHAQMEVQNPSWQKIKLICIF